MNLSRELVDGVKKFVFFVGYGHSIIGSLMDAHPHVAISNEFFLFTKFNVLNKATDSRLHGKTTFLKAYTSVVSMMLAPGFRRQRRATH